MENIYKILFDSFEAGQKAIQENEKRFKQVEDSFNGYLTKAKETLLQKQNVNPKPTKRFARINEENSQDEEDQPLSKLASTKQDSTLNSTEKDLLRPIRTAKLKANQNLNLVKDETGVEILHKETDQVKQEMSNDEVNEYQESSNQDDEKELPTNLKMRNDNNTVTIKTERESAIRASRSTDSVKENRTPSTASASPAAEEVQAARESEKAPRTGKRSNSVEILASRMVEINISDDDDDKLMPPPSAVPKKPGKKTRTKQKTKEPEKAEEPLRMTRSKIKKEKLSSESHVDTTSSASSAASTPEPTKKGKTDDGKPKKKYPLPILVKIEPKDKQSVSEASSKQSSNASTIRQTEEPHAAAVNATFDIPNAEHVPGTDAIMNETVTISENPNSTVTLSKNPHDSLMTEDNTDDEDQEMPMLPPPPAKAQQIPLPTLKLKKNEVFNPYQCSPVKQKVQAFEKHAVASYQGTPGKSNTMPSKINTLKNGTPSKFATYSSKTTPLNKHLKASVASSAPPKGSIISSSQRVLKKGQSMSQESLDDKKKLSSLAATEDKRRIREEKQRLAQIQREALEKEKRENALRQQQERDEKHRRLMQEKEDRMKMDALKKKLLKENQTKKYAEEKAKKEEFLAPKPAEPHSSSKNDSLHLKMQKQIMLEKAALQKKTQSFKTYDFDMLHTDDSTDDESRPSKKRPPVPEWSKKQKRKPVIAMQSYTDPNVLDSLFSSKPISVDLREIFPAIDVRKLVRNSSAIWRTPPKHY